MKRFVVRLPREAAHECRVAVGPGALRRIAALARSLEPGHAFLVADRRLAALARTVARGLRSGGWRTDVALVAASEQAKSVARASALHTSLLHAGATRATVVFALGGGVIGDLAGYVAATYLRGVRWAGLPTTLLAQVDSSIGGKTAVNHPLGKNLVGAIHQPSLVVADTEVLETLSTRDRISGLAEIFKIALVRDARLFARLSRERVATPATIARAMALKAAVVAADERETTGLRQILNFGHTVGHALEGVTGYRRYRHGEAVIWGMRVAVALSVAHGGLARTAAQSIDAVLRELPVPELPRGLSARRLAPYLGRDKKGGTFVLLSAIGRPVCQRGLTLAQIDRALAEVAR